MSKFVCLAMYQLKLVLGGMSSAACYITVHELTRLTLDLSKFKDRRDHFRN